MPLRPLRLLGTLLLMASLCATSAAPGAMAQEDGVTLDPGDPAAKEYSLPHAEARREASGAADARVSQGSAEAAIFGEGITPDAESQTGTSAGNGEATRRASGDDEGDAGAATASRPSDPGADQSAPQPTEAGGLGSTTALIGGGMVALLVAGIGGLALRAVRGPTDA
ncbi:MAG: hypothetical protein JHD16_02965 [Solirubrobacteraceae bacterium]|nr:hypothetical protein [Solirubrobacteraceae bacterium]